MKPEETLFNDPNFKTFLQSELDRYLNRPALKQGMRYRRSPMDAIAESGNMSADYFISQYRLISEQKSTLSANQRKEVLHIIFSATQRLISHNLKKK